MSTIGKRVIYVGPADDSNHKPLTVEGLALEADILPGMAVEQTVNGLQKNATVATEFSHQLLVADKNELQSKSVDDAWTLAQTMQAIHPRSGEFVNVLVVAGNNITERGTALTVDGAGKFKIAVTPATIGATSEQVLGFADEIINVAADTLVRMRVA